MAMKRRALVLADFVDGADIRMVQSRCGLRFALETGDSLRILRHVVGQKLEGNEAMKADVLGFIDDAHAAAAQFVDDAVVRDGLANHRQRQGQS
ncbi:MAG: hypothetical protein WCA98_07540 [Candidatus Acidiferrales bacterium]